MIASGDGTILAGAHNESSFGIDPVAHAEMLAFRRAGAPTGAQRDRLLASTLVAAPVNFCNVLDPVTGGAVTYVRPAPSVMQIRLPMVEGADRLEIHADASTTEPASPSRLLASIPLGAK